MLHGAKNIAAKYGTYNKWIQVYIYKFSCWCVQIANSLIYICFKIRTMHANKIYQSILKKKNRVANTYMCIQTIQTVHLKLIKKQK